MTIWFDMDGTISNLYDVANWLEMLIHEDPKPYLIANPIGNMSLLARLLNELQRMGFQIGIISWLAKNSTENYAQKVTAAKLTWLKKHLPSVHWDIIHIVEYGRNKWETCGEGILFYDEARNREQWNGKAFHPEMIFDILKALKREKILLLRSY